MTSANEGIYMTCLKRGQRIFSFISSLFLLGATLFICPQALAQTTATDRTQTTGSSTATTTYNNSGPSAYNSATSSNSTQKLTGVVGVAMGATIAKASCGNWATAALCVIGIGGAVESLATLNNADGNTNPSSNPLGSGIDCTSNPALCTGGSAGNPYSGVAFNNTPLASDYANLQQAAATQGVDLNNPASVQSFLDSNAATISGANAPGGASMPLSAAQQAIVDNAKKYALAKAAKFSVSSVATESGGSGGSAFANRNKDNSELDINGFMEKLNPSKKSSAGNQGLQRNLASGEPIGIASDNIFSIMSRRYQSKIQARVFLNK